MKVVVLEYIPTPLAAFLNLSFWEKILVSLGYVIPIGEVKKPDWSDRLTFYLFSCPNCGEREVGYLHRFEGRQYLVCKCGVNCGVNRGIGGLYISQV